MEEKIIKLFGEGIESQAKEFALDFIHDKELVKI